MLEITNINPNKWFRLNAFLNLNLLNPHVWLAGGAVRSIIDGTKIADYDLFFSSNTAMYITDDRLKKLGAKCVYRAKDEKLVTYRFGDLKIQLIGISFHDTMEDVIGRFHFTAAQFITDGHKIYTPSKDNIKHALKKKLVLSNNDLPHTPVGTVKAICKYKNKGYEIDDAALTLVQKLLQASPEDYDALDVIFYGERN